MYLHLEVFFNAGRTGSAQGPLLQIILSLWRVIYLIVFDINCI